MISPSEQKMRAISVLGCMVRRARHIFVRLAPVLPLAMGAAACSSMAKQPTAPDVRNCSYSSQVFDSDAAQMHRKVPAYLRVMTGRYVEIVQAARGYKCSGTATVAFNGHEYLQAGNGDDPGMAELIPTISSLSGMSLAETLDLTVFAVLSVGILIGYAGFWRLYPDKRVRWLGAAVFLCLGLAQAAVADVYIFQTSPLIGGIPWVLHFALRRKPFPLAASMALLAFCCSWCSLVRSGTAPICLGFLIPLLPARYRGGRMLITLLLVALACVPSLVFERFLISRRDTVLAGLGQTTTAVNSHPIWHSIYVGLGFIPNSEVPEYNDAVAIAKVRSIDPTAMYTSAQYELILKGEVLKIARQRPGLLIANLTAKASIVTILAGILLFPVRRLLFAEREVFWLDGAFVLAIGMSAMNAILVVPRPRYLLTFVCLTFLYSSTKLCRELSNRMEQQTGSSAKTGLMVRLFCRENRKKVFRNEFGMPI